MKVIQIQWNVVVHNPDLFDTHRTSAATTVMTKCSSADRRRHHMPLEDSITKKADKKTIFGEIGEMLFEDTNLQLVNKSVLEN